MTLLDLYSTNTIYIFWQLPLLWYSGIRLLVGCGYSCEYMHTFVI